MMKTWFQSVVLLILGYSMPQAFSVLTMSVQGYFSVTFQILEHKAHGAPKIQSFCLEAYSILLL